MNEQWNQLAQQALEARKMSYSPYSHFSVGAALLCADGSIYSGCNIENASYTPSNCAERTAFFRAVAEGKREFKAVAIAGGKSGSVPEDFCPPCGVCLQVMLEFCDPDTFWVILVKQDGEIRPVRLRELIPMGFSLRG